MKRLATIFALALFTLPMLAQSTAEQSSLEVKVDTVRGVQQGKTAGNWFIGIQAGVNHSLSENARFGSFGAMTKPSVAITVGRYFAPAIGARIQLSYMRQASRADSEAIDAYPSIYGKGNYNFNMFGGYLDGLFNFNNIFGQYNEKARFNVVGILGIGLSHSFGFDDKVEAWAPEASTWSNIQEPAPYKIYTDANTYFAVRGGLQLNYALNSSLNLNLEATITATDDGYNGICYDDKWDAYANVMLGVTYFFKNKQGERRFQYTEVNDHAVIAELNQKINEERAKAPVAKTVVEVKKEVVKNEILDMTVSFAIEKYQVSPIQKKNLTAVAQYLEDHPDTNLVITGYSDAKTGTPEYNLRLSKRRAESVYNTLVKEFNVDPSRLRIDYKGDTLQPYKHKNAWNRVVIFITEPR